MLPLFFIVAVELFAAKKIIHCVQFELMKIYGTLFFETSSKNAQNVMETMEAIARILQEKEDKQIDDVLNLRMKDKKKSCC